MNGVVNGMQRVAVSAQRKQMATSAGTAVSTDLVKQLNDLLPGKCSTTAEDLQTHGRDQSFHPVSPPGLVVWPESTADVAAVHRACSAARTPIVPFGMGTSVEGHIAALHGGVCIDMSRMNGILDVSAADLTARVQAGVTHQQLNRHLASQNMYFSVNPGADCTLGGLAACRASGTNTVRHGTMRENVRALEAVLADGRVVSAGRGVVKSSAGYDLAHLIVGSEGTLATITELTVRLWQMPPAISAAVCTFKALPELVACAAAVASGGAAVAKIEMIDEVTMRAVNAYSKTDYAEEPTLLFEFIGTEQGVKEASEAAARIVAQHGGSRFAWAHGAEERQQLWHARSHAYWASIALKPGARGFPTDMCVPISKLPECVVRCKALAVQHALLAPMLGHVGDGNFHMILLVDPEDAEELSRAERVVDEMVHIAHSLGGTCTGEHGVGYGKLKHLLAEHGSTALEVMHAIKKALDPLDIMNPGKLGSKPAFAAAVSRL